MAASFHFHRPNPCPLTFNSGLTLLTLSKAKLVCDPGQPLRVVRITGHPDRGGRQVPGWYASPTSRTARTLSVSTTARLRSPEGQQASKTHPARNNLPLSAGLWVWPGSSDLHPTTFTKHLDQLLNEEIMGRFLKKLMAAPEVKPLLSDEHFSVDGTLLQARASHASLERIDGQDDPPPPPSGPGEGFGAPKEGKKRAKGDFRGIKLSNKTHRSGTDPDALLARKSKVHPAQPSYRGHVLMDNRHALIVDCRVTQAVGTGERDAASAMAADRPGAHQKTIGADKNYDTRGFVAEMRRICPPQTPPLLNQADSPYGSYRFIHVPSLPRRHSDDAAAGRWPPAAAVQRG